MVNFVTQLLLRKFMPPKTTVVGYLYKDDKNSRWQIHWPFHKKSRSFGYSKYENDVEAAKEALRVAWAVHLDLGGDACPHVLP